MNAAFLSAMAALAGSAIGALASLGRTWLNQHAQERARQLSELRERRTRLYQEFIEEASRLYVDSLTYDLGDDVSRFVHIYSLISQLRLASSTNVVAQADDVMRLIAESYQAPSISDFQNITEDWERKHLDILRGFSEACRKDLHH